MNPGNFFDWPTDLFIIGGAWAAFALLYWWFKRLEAEEVSDEDWLAGYRPDQSTEVIPKVDALEGEIVEIIPPADADRFAPCLSGQPYGPEEVVDPLSMSFDRLTRVRVEEREREFDGVVWDALELDRDPGYAFQWELSADNRVRELVAAP